MAKNNEDYNYPSQEMMWINGLPLKTDYGVLKPIKIKSYLRYAQDFEFLKLQGWELKEILKKQSKGSALEEIVVEQIENSSFIEMVRTNFFGLRDKYLEIFSKFIEDFDVRKFSIMNSDEFELIRDLILRYNGITYHKKSQDKEVEKFNRMERLLKKNKGGGEIEFDAVFALLMTREGGGHKPHDINDFTILQFYSAFNSIQNQKNHDATIIFKTVDPKIEIIEFFQSIRPKEDGIIYKDMDALMGTMKNHKNAPIKL